MPRITLLGSAATLAGPHNDSIYLLVQDPSGDILVDCAGSPPHRLAQAGGRLDRLRGVLLTHDHADHVYGLPLLVQALMLAKWEETWQGPLSLWGLPETLTTAHALLEALSLHDRIAIDYRPLPAAPHYLAVETEELTLWTTPVEHSRPTVGVRLQDHASGRALAYSSDTTPCPGVQTLAAGVDILLHEATVMQPSPAHSTPAQAGRAAAQAAAGELVLVHFDPRIPSQELVDAAAREYDGPIRMGADGMQFDL